MYVVNTDITINWTMSAEVAAPLLSDLSVKVEYPNGTTEIDIEIQRKNYIKPSGNKLGLISHVLTPNLKGIWKVTLYVGDTPVSTQSISVWKNDTTVKKFVNSNML